MLDAVERNPEIRVRVCDVEPPSRVFISRTSTRKETGMVGKRDVKKAAEATSWSPIRVLSGWGVRSGHGYTAGFAAIGISLVSWLVSRAKKDDSKAQSDRWGLFVGQWAPTFFALGIALKNEEKGTA
ncbi:MAG: hypothetical protein ACTH31_08495 [Pseudoclavibacter sp.]